MNARAELSDVIERLTTAETDLRSALERVAALEVSLAETAAVARGADNSGNRNMRGIRLRILMGWANIGVDTSGAGAIASAEAFGTARLDQDITPLAIDSAEAFGDHSVATE